MKRINLFLSDSEYGNLNTLVKKYGGKPTSFLRTLLKQAFEKEYGGYKSKSVRVESIKEEELTPEQLCERAGGKIEMRNGEKKCVFKMSEGFERVFPVDRSDIFPKIN